LSVHDAPRQATVLLTGAGGAAVPTLIERLRGGGRRVVAVDADPNAAGLQFADKGYRVPFARDPQFVPTMLRICRLERVDAIVPLVDEELLPVASLALELNIPSIGPRPAFTALCLDKYALMQSFLAQGLPLPATRLLGAGIAGMSFPLILKPRVGRGSRGVKVVRNIAEYTQYVAASRPDPDGTLVQSYVEGLEFTVSVVVWRDGSVRAVVPKEVIDKRGVTRVAITRRNAAIDTLAREIQAKLHADGPFNVQLRLHGETNTPLTFEINPRFSTTITLTQAAGVDELGALVDVALGAEPGADAWRWREGVTLIRRTCDHFVDEGDYRRRRTGVELPS